MMYVEDCCEILDTMRVPITASDREEGEYPYYGANGIQDHVAGYIFDDELVLLAEDGGNFGSKERPIAYRVSGKCWVNNHAHVLKPKAGLNVDYLCYSLMFYKVDGMVNGATRQKLTQAAMRKMKIPYRSMDEQLYIVDELNRILKIKEQRQRELTKLDDLIKARFVEMFGIPIANTNNWPMDKAENLCTLVTDGSHFSPKACEEGYPMLSVKDMRQNGFDYSDCKLVDDETFEILKKQGCVPQADDVLIAKDGSYFTRAFAITEYKDQAILSSIGMYRPDIDKILPRFLASYLMTNEVIEFVNRGYVTGTALRRVIIKGLKNIPVYMPPMELQKEFVQFAEQVDKSKVVYMCIHKKLGKQKKQIKYKIA